MPTPPIVSEMPLSPVAAIVHGADEQDTHRLLAGFAHELRCRGHRVLGVVQLDTEFSAQTGKRMTLADLDGNRCFPISQALGPGAGACSLDPAGVAEASVVLREALAARPDLAVANRFGVLEAAGSGFADEMLALMADGIPVLTVVASKFLAEWRAFTGDAAVELPPDPAALHAWFAGLARAGQ